MSSGPPGGRREPDAVFAHPRLARIYDAFDGDRGDLDLYLGIATEVGARSLLDVGCGTGTLACLAAARGIEVVAIDPARASLDVARAKPAASQVRWIEGEAIDLPSMTVDLVTMTGNVAMVFVDDEHFVATLCAARRALGDGGTLAFEVRDPSRAAWREWTRESTWQRIDVPGVGPVEGWVDLVEVALPLVTFRTTYRFEREGDELASMSTLRFRTRDEIAAIARRSGLAVVDVRDAPDRSGLEHVYVCRPA